jgi:hypothetical protein
MKKTNIILAIVLLTAGLAVVQAQETVTNESLAMVSPTWADQFPQHGTGQMFNITPFAYPESVGGKVGTGFLNILFGLGSWISGDWESGIKITLYQGIGIGLTVLGALWLSSMDDAAIFFFWWLPVSVGVCGVVFWFIGIIEGFAAPFKGPKTQRLNEPRNWTVALFPTKNGSVAGALAFTAHF